ncbi:single-stranded DNA-binding protein [Candidatus Parcubacteria bacterium]|nr:MAG: single-stranded DNA-binding protein [Candidatus Parcubacteria bacterium]
MDLNKVQIIGRLTRDPEIRTTPNGQSVAQIGVATNFVWTDAQGQKQERVEYHNVVAWRKLAEIIGQYLKKGAKVYFEGRLQTRDWTGQDNVKRYRTEIIAENMIMLDSRGGSGAPFNNSAPFPSDAPAPSTPQNDTPVINIDEPTDNSPEDEIKVENIPF